MRRGPLAAAIDAGRVLTALRENELVPAGSRALTLDRAWPWRGDGLCALFVESRGRRRLGSAWAVLRPPASGVPRTLERSGVLSPLPVIDAWAMPLTADPALAAAEMLDGKRALALLRSRLPAGARSLRVRPVGYKPLRRLTVEYGPRNADGRDARIYGKALRRTDLERVQAISRALARSAGAADLALPSGVVQPWRMLVFERRRGTELERLIPGPAAARGVAMAGEALAGLHGGGAPLAARHSRERELETLDRWLGCTVRACWEMGERLTAGRRELTRLATAAGAGSLVPSHRDFHPGQLLAAPEGMTVLDLDTAAMAEPELDAGNFLAHLDLFELTRRGVRAAGLGEEFCAAYESRAGSRLDSRRLLFYRACAVLRLACVYRFRSRGSVFGSLLARRGLNLVDSGVPSSEVI